MNQKPNFIIIGAMKCATSTLHDQLAMQPGIFMTTLKEPNFFSNDEQYSKGLEWYISNFKNAKDTDICGESSTHYTKLPTYPNTVQRIYQELPNVKLIYVMRHPIDRLISQYIHEWTFNLVPNNINKAIDTYIELVEYSLYSKQIKPYIETFGKKQILPIFFERVITNKQEELEKICHFIDYLSKPTWSIEKKAQNISAERLRENNIRDFFVEAPVLKEIRQQLIPVSWRKKVKSLWQIKEKPQINPQKLAELKAIFDEDLAEMGSLLGVKLSCDSFKSIVTNKSLHWKF